MSKRVNNKKGNRVGGKRSRHPSKVRGGDTKRDGRHDGPLVYSWDSMI